LLSTLFPYTTLFRSYIEGDSEQYSDVGGGYLMSYDKVMQFRTQLVIGIKQTIKAIKNYEIQEVFIAKDVDYHITEKLIETAKKFEVPNVLIDTKKNLGKKCDIEVGESFETIKYVG